ncbi:hypothetical protein AVEN_51678-1 [Araneus ventricosus]|uniref:Uncharacterized protein n=1 Tax=Araneus ventricosus TaxID=182803 RepID=A0A4Y2IG69_ARAVE|nr:hypothetical protein AVEN_51678-1 [Araneus ventricosus]
MQSQLLQLRKTTGLKNTLESFFNLRSNGLSFYEFRPRFALFPVFETGRSNVARGLVIASVVSRVMAVNSSHIKGKGIGQTASVHPFTRALLRYLISTNRRNGATVRIIAGIEDLFEVSSVTPIEEK